MKFDVFWEAVSPFFFGITLYFSYLNLIRTDNKKQKPIFKSHFQNFIMVAKNSETR